MFEVWNVLTYRDYDFTDEKSGRQIKGRTLHCTRPTQDPEWPGVEYAKISVASSSPAFLKAPELGASYEIAFDRRGKVVSMKKVS